jgi:hypothetical protein
MFHPAVPSDSTAMIKMNTGVRANRLGKTSARRRSTRACQAASKGLKFERVFSK